MFISQTALLLSGELTMHHTSNSTTQRGQTTVVANLLQIAAPETRRLTSEWEKNIMSLWDLKSLSTYQIRKDIQNS